MRRREESPVQLSIALADDPARLQHAMPFMLEVVGKQDNRCSHRVSHVVYFHMLSCL